MKVVLASFDPVPAPKGASAHILANLAALREEHEVSLVTVGAQPLPGERHIVVSSAERNWLRRAVEFGDRCAGIFAKNQFDVHHVRSPFEGLATPPGNALVYEVNAFYSVELSYHYPRSIELPAVRQKIARMEAALLDRADVLVTTNPVTAQHIVDRGGRPDAVHIVPNAPSFALLSEVPEPSGGPVRIAYIGTLSSWQGLPELLRVLPEVRGEWTLSVATGASKSQTKPLQKLVRKLGLADRTHWVEPQSGVALRDFLADVDIGLAPLSPCARNVVQGCMPVKVLDYMAAGVAVLAPDLPSITHVLGPDAPVYRAYSRTALRERLQQLIDDSDLRRASATTNLHRVGATFSMDHQANALREAYAAL